MAQGTTHRLLRRPAVRLAAVAACAAIALALALPQRRAGGIIGSDTILRSDEDLDSLRILLADNVTRADLLSFCDTHSLSRVLTSSDAAAPGENCVDRSGVHRRTRHWFVFAELSTHCSRIYEAAYTTCRSASGAYTLAVASQGFGSETATNVEPILRGEAAFIVFTRAIQNAEIGEEIVNALRQAPLAFVRVSFVAEDAGTHFREFRCTFADTDPEKSQPVVLVEHDALYDPSTGEVLFE